MKADISDDGKLIIYGENNIEVYALKKWWDNYLHGTKESELLVLVEIYKKNEGLILDNCNT